MLPLKDDQPSYSTPYVNWFLIGINIAIFFYQWTLGPREADVFLRTYGEVPSHLWSGEYSLGQLVLPFFTSMFLHGSWMHVLGNMWALYIFGDNVEDFLGHSKYLVFYLLTGVLAMSTQVAVDVHSTAPTVGASGAVAGVLGAYFLVYPKARVLTWVFELLVVVVWIPAWVILGYWFVYNFLSGTKTMFALHKQSMGGIAFWAHVGGFVAGLVMVKIFGERARRSPYAYR